MERQHDDRVGFVPKLTDFGLAKLLEQDGDETRSGALMGTPRYMAPEQAEGRRRDVGPHTDVYGLGVVLYEMLTGRPPFCGGSDADTLRRVTSEETVSLRRLRRDVPRDLEAICLKCLEKDPRRRYSNAAELADELRRLLAGKPTLARPLGPIARAIKWARRRPAAAALFLVSALATLMIFSGGWWYSSKLYSAINVSEMHRARSVMTQKELGTKNEILARALFVSHIQRASVAWENGQWQEAEALLAREAPESQDVAEADFTRDYLAHRIARAQEAVFRTAPGSPKIYSIAFPMDGSYLFLGSEEGTLIQRSTRTDHVVNQWICHSHCVNSLVTSPDGATVVTGGCDGLIKVWDWPNMTLRHTLEGHSGSIQNLSMASDGRRFVAGDDETGMRVWDAVDGKLVANLRDEISVSRKIAISPDGQKVASASPDGYVAQFNVQSGSLIAKSYVGAPLHAVAFNFRSDVARVGGNRQMVEIGTDGTTLSAFPERGPVRAIAEYPSGEFFAYGGRNGTFVLRSHADTQRVRHGSGDHTVVWLGFSNDGRKLLSVASDHSAVLWNVSALWKGPARVTPHVPDVQEAGFSPALDRIFTAEVQGTVKVWSAETGKQLETLPRDSSSPVKGIHFSPDGCTLALNVYPSEKHHYEIWRTDKGGMEFAHSLTRKGRILALTVDGKLLAVTEDGGPTRIVDRNTGDSEAELLTPDQKVEFAAFSPDARALALNVEGNIQVWSTRPPKLLWKLAKQGNNIRPPAFSPDGRLLAVVWSPTVILLEVRSGKQVGRIEDVDSNCYRLAFSLDGKTLALACGGMVKLLDVASGGEMLQLHTGHWRTCGLQFSSDGKTLVTWTGQPELKVAYFSTSERTIARVLGN